MPLCCLGRLDGSCGQRRVHGTRIIVKTIKNTTINHNTDVAKDVIAVAVTRDLVSSVMPMEGDALLRKMMMMTVLH
jgi:hypothetical protein